RGLAMKRLAIALVLLSPTVLAAPGADRPQFQTSDRCFVCHNGKNSTTGLDVTIGADWRASVMANSSRDPYWQASVRRETLDRRPSRESTEADCSIRHMPGTRYEARLQGKPGQVFSHLPFRPGAAPNRGAVARNHDREAADGVTCTVCHQISAAN